MTFGSLFAGCGGIDLGLEKAGMECAWQVESHDYAVLVLEKHWPHVKRYNDVRTVEAWDDEGWRTINRTVPVDLICGGFPCQDISLASATGVGIIGERSGLWKEFARILAEVRPAFVLAENVPALRNRGLAMVLQDLWSLGYDAEWHCIPASAFGAPHERDRIWIVAYPAGMFRGAIIWGKPVGIVQGGSDFGWTAESSDTESDRCGSWWAGRFDPSLEGQQPSASSTAIANADSSGLEEWIGFTGDDGQEQPAVVRGHQNDANPNSEPLVRVAVARGERHAWTTEPGVVRMVHGVPNRVDRLGRLGNAVVPQIAEWIGRRILEASL